MNEIKSIVSAYRESAARGEPAALATVVGVAGSAYRRPGAKMLVTEGGVCVGGLSAGCLERDARTRALKVIEIGAPVLVRYDMTATDDLIWGLGLGCNGVVEVLIEPPGAKLAGYIEFLEQCLASGEPGAASTVVRGRTGTPEINSRFLLRPHSDIDIADGINAQHVADILNAREQGVSSLKKYQSENGEIITVFIEAVAPPVQLIVFGAETDALPVVETAAKIGWETIVVDPNARALTLERFAAADKILLARPAEIAARVPVGARAVTLVMTHNYSHDRALLEFLCASKARYIGVLGPRSRTERIIAELESENSEFVFEPAMEQRLFAPVGLDTGAETPEEIAISILGEIRAVLSGRTGGFLRHRKASIHEPAAGSEINAADADIADVLRKVAI